MLLSVYTKVNITRRNQTYYREKNYSCKIGDLILVKVDDLNPNGTTHVLVQCNGTCGVIKEMEYCTYLLNINSTEIHEYYCTKCNHQKIKQLADLKQKQGLLNRNDRYYWLYKENCVKELEQYIQIYKNMKDITKNDYILYANISKYHNLEILILKMGYTIEEMYPNRPYGYYDNINNVVNPIKVFIDKNNRFPTQKEISEKIGICLEHIYKHFDSIDELKSYIGYNNKNDLIDNRGDRNRSTYELYVANYLLSQGLGFYKREQCPFKQFDKSLKYRSDFSFYLVGGKEIHIEVWGYNKNDTKIHINYLNKRKIKEFYYNKYKDNIILISIEKNTFLNTFEEIQLALYKIFSEYLILSYKNIDINSLIPLNKYNDYEIFEILMKYSNSTGYLPKTSDVFSSSSEGASMVRYIQKRYGGFIYFAKKFNVKLNEQNYITNKIEFFNVLQEMLNEYGHILDKEKIDELNDCKYNGFYSILRNKGKINLIIDFSQYCIDQNIKINIFVVEYLNQIITESIPKYHHKIEDEIKDKAIYILKEINGLFLTKSA